MGEGISGVKFQEINAFLCLSKKSNLSVSTQIETRCYKFNSLGTGLKIAHLKALQIQLQGGVVGLQLKRGREHSYKVFCKGWKALFI